MHGFSHHPRLFCCTSRGPWRLPGAIRRPSWPRNVPCKGPGGRLTLNGSNWRVLEAMLGQLKDGFWGPCWATRGVAWGLCWDLIKHQWPGCGHRSWWRCFRNCPNNVNIKIRKCIWGIIAILLTIKHSLVKLNVFMYDLMGQRSEYSDTACAIRWMGV